jgi:cardiolipin synthase
MNPPVSLLLPHEYVRLLTEDVRKARQRITVFSHIIAYDEATDELIGALCAAAKRGVTVEVAGDVFTYGILGGWQMVPLKPNERIRALRTMVKKFKKSGVQYRWIGQFGPFLFAGRTHVKWAVVDDIVYSFGGINLYAKGLGETDYMLREVNAELGDHLIQEHARIARADRLNKFYRSHEFVSQNGHVLIDGGRPRDSIIYRRACALAKKATDIVYVSQYCPTGPLGKVMAERGAKLYFSHWRQAVSLNNRLLIRSSMFLTGYETLYDRPAFIHAKFILFTMPDGSKVALSGSHNFVRAGVVLGTREIALETSDPSVVAALEEFLVEHIY